MANDNKPSKEMTDYTPEEIAEVVLKFRPPPDGYKYQQKDKADKKG